MDPYLKYLARRESYCRLRTERIRKGLLVPKRYAPQHVLPPYGDPTLEATLKWYDDMGLAHVRRGVHRLWDGPAVCYVARRSAWDGRRIVATVDPLDRPVQLLAAISRLSPPVASLLTNVMDGAELDEAAAEVGLLGHLDKLVPRLQEWLRPYL